MGIPFLTVVKNLIIPVIFSVIIIFCLAKFPTGTTNVFKGFSVFVNIIAMIGLALAMINDLILTPWLARALSIWRMSRSSVCLDPPVRASA